MEEKHSEDQKKPTRKQIILRELRAISLIIFAILIIRSIFFEPYRIPSGSMIPTLMIGDFILVNKAAYGFKVPFSDSFGDPIYILGKSLPKRGDVIVFKFPSDPSINYIKRVLALPGDTLEIREKVVYLNGKALPLSETSGTLFLKEMPETMKETNWKFYKTKTGEHDHIVQLCADNYYKTDYEKITVPEGQLFVMGDNRDYSFDSRFWGFVPQQNIKGKALFVWFSALLPFLNDGLFKFNSSRIGTMIH